MDIAALPNFLILHLSALISQSDALPRPGDAATLPLARAVWSKLQPHIAAKPSLQEAVTELAATPDDEHWQTIFRAHLSRLLEQNRELREAIAPLLQATPEPPAPQISQTVTGNQNQVIGQVTGGTVIGPTINGPSFNISGSTMTNVTGTGDIFYQEVPKPEARSQEFGSNRPPSPIHPSTRSGQRSSTLFPSLSKDPPIHPSTHPPIHPPTSPLTLFFSYSHADEPLRDELAKHLRILERNGVIAGWHDRRITPGAEWANEIDQWMEAAQVILLLVSADFFASDYCWDVEVKRAMERHEAGEACVIPVILRPVEWRSAPFGKLQALPQDGRPVTSWGDRDEAFLSVVRGIEAVVRGMAQEQG